MKAIRVLACAAAFAALCAVARPAWAAGSFEEGERLFRADRPADAIPVLEQAVGEAGVDEHAWVYLALCYQELGRYDQAVSTLRRGLPQATRLKAVFYFDLANVFVLQGKNSFAVDTYGQAIDADGSYAPAFLNRANARIVLKDYQNAASDYRRYLDLMPNDPQRPQIEELLKRLDAGIATAQAAAAAAEAQKQAEEAAKKALMDQVTASLKAAADETTSLSAGAGDVQGYTDELKIDE
ncbi:MAG TPA: tetratricopeptide repeat protein [Rectinemataceae bacterium]|nr:tetratricopeptide repeat protein [Rectinemataceae bacterium]